MPLRPTDVFESAQIACGTLLVPYIKYINKFNAMAENI
jgi:hypothetical protein